MNKITGWIALAIFAAAAAGGIAGCSSSDAYAGKHTDTASGHRSSTWTERGTGRVYYYDENGAKVYVPDGGGGGNAHSPATGPSPRGGT